MSRIILFVVLLLFSQIASALSYTIEITEKEIQQKVSAMMPIQITKSLMTVNLLDPKVSLLKETDEISVASPLELVVPGGLKGSGYVSVKGSVSYDPTTGEFFIKNPIITKIEIKNLPEKYLPKVRDLSQLAIEKSLATHAIYRLKDNDLKQKMAKSVLQSVTVKNEKVLIMLGVF